MELSCERWQYCSCESAIQRLKKHACLTQIGTWEYAVNTSWLLLAPPFVTCTTAIVVFPITLRANPRPPALLHRPPLAPPPSPYSLSYLCVGFDSEADVLPYSAQFDRARTSGLARNHSTGPRTSDPGKRTYHTSLFIQTLYFQKFRGITMDNVRVDEAWKSTDEMMLVGSGSLVRPVIQIQWDEQVIGDGKEGPPSETLLNFIPEDMNPVLHRSEYQFLIEAKLDS
ncbi:hypothetical protein V6N13_057847 [Hibiscus sabdariffa]